MGSALYGIARPHHTRYTADRAHELRSHLTISEARLWGAIKGRAAGALFRRQVPIGQWIADFASFDPRIVIEVDDPSHDWKEEWGRTGDLERAGFVVLRFTNEEIAKHLDDAFGTIEALVQALKEPQT